MAFAVIFYPLLAVSAFCFSVALVTAWALGGE
jgi:hypothetical protein